MFQGDLQVPKHKITAVDCASRLTSAGLSPHSCFDSAHKTSSSSMRSCPTEINKTTYKGVSTGFVGMLFWPKEMFSAKNLEWAKLSKLSPHNDFSVMSLFGAKNPILTYLKIIARPTSKETRGTAVGSASQVSTIKIKCWRLKLKEVCHFWILKVL